VVSSTIVSGVEVGERKVNREGAVSEVRFVIVLLGLNLSINIAIVFGVERRSHL